MIVRTYGRRSRSMSRSYSESGLNDNVSQENSQDIYSFGFSSQDSVHWSSNFNNSQDPFDVGSSQELTILPSRKEDREDFEGGHDDGVLWKPKKVKMFDWEPYGSLNSSQESDEFLMEYGSLEKFDGGLQEPKKAKKTGKGKENGVLLKKKKKVKSKDLGLPSLGPTATLMETQECGEMMEHMDEVNFALDGLRKGQPVRIRRASLLSLLSICGTAQQRRLLRAHGMAKTIIDAVLGLSFDDSPSNLAAAALFYILTSDGGDDHLLDSPSCIRFLIKLLKPVAAPASTAKAPTIGSKLLAMRLDADVSQDCVKGLDSTSSSITRKVQDVLVSCKEIKPNDGNDGHNRPELNPKWISLLTMAKACLSTISIEDTSGTMRKSGGNFKEKLRELGGLDAVFVVARSCHSVLEGWSKQSSQSILDSKDNAAVESLVLLLKCLKIMENATFLSMDNQNHLLQMKGKFDSLNSPRSFTKLILSVIKILSGASLRRTSLESSNDGKVCNLSDGTARASELRSLSDNKDGGCQILCIDSSTTCYTSEGSCSQKNLSETQTDQIGSSRSNLDYASTSTSDSWQLKLRIESSKSGSCSGASEDFGFGVNKNSSRVNFLIGDSQRSNGEKSLELMEESQDPFAFDDDFEPSRWDLLSTKQKPSQTQIRQTSLLERDDGCQSLIVRSQQESSSQENKQESSSKENNQSGQASCCSDADAEMSTLLADCLLTAVKVLMNLTNDNPMGCQQIAASGGLEALSALIASHFPSFSLHLDCNGSSKSTVGSDSDGHLSDQELDFLVAILGLLVNLVEKDGCNRSRLAAASVSLPGSEGLFEGETQTDVIPLLCAIFLANQGAGEAAGEGKSLQWDDEEAVLQGEKEAEKMIIEAYSALLLAFLSTESKSIRQAIAGYLPDHKLSVLVPVLERFVEFHMTLNMISPETHSTVLEVIESCRVR
ncbi:wings apart-like protein 2 [Lycium ferocissimum]|uniref:wings apart-like protein 2 n=1 Tax=Lycium ferocissimum TaxID=112874 RepID=UPI002815E2D2|nr:wings apart-like protein 2 [Lycium ferocissimum]